VIAAEAAVEANVGISGASRAIEPSWQPLLGICPMCLQIVDEI